MRIVGFDPGLNALGYAVIEQKSSASGVAGENFQALHYGCWMGSGGGSISEKLLFLFTEIKHFLTAYRPDQAAVESIFLPSSQAHNIKAIVPLSYARGIILLSLERHGIPLREYSPLEIKKTVTGVGRADKQQVSMLVKILLGLKEDVKTSHESDALAAALCLAQNKIHWHNI